MGSLTMAFNFRFLSLVILSGIVTATAVTAQDVQAIIPPAAAIGVDFSIIGSGFGSEPSKVELAPIDGTLGSKVLPIIASWTDSKIVCHIGSANSGDYSVGVQRKGGPMVFAPASTIRFTAAGPLGQDPFDGDPTIITTSPGQLVQFKGAFFGMIVGKVKVGQKLAVIPKGMWTDSLVTYRVPQLGPGDYTVSLMTKLGSTTGVPIRILPKSVVPGAMYSKLGVLALESQFVAMSGYGAVQVINDPGTTDRHTVPTQVPGFYYIYFNPLIFSGLPPAIGEFFYRHEFGHAYLKHTQIPGQNFRVNEHYADAFGIRTLFAVFGFNTCQQVINYLSSTGVPPDSTHPSHAARAIFAQAVLAAVMQNPLQVPKPPPTTAKVLFRNPYSSAISIYINGQGIATLAPYGFVGSTYLVELYADFVTGDPYQFGIQTIVGPSTTPVIVFGGHSYSFP